MQQNNLTNLWCSLWSLDRPTVGLRTTRLFQKGSARGPLPGNPVSRGLSGLQMAAAAEKRCLLRAGAPTIIRSSVAPFNHGRNWPLDIPRRGPTRIANL
ncbi:hypothetical protein NDU88_006076 [Pleurodeles waltl]|uniref:Uncharacterized protein n=1 Tax=Pleurodeles waltl TaxID=8319 RepID=A0AAV7NSD9_PLEWA|nr:hypothetical protein NDU88_006076 [Pleurodeles waltl]